MNTFIKLNGQIYEINNREYEEIETGGQFERMLDGTGTQDVGPIKSQWTFNLLVNSRQYDRLRTLKRLQNSITLIDVTNTSYITKWTNGFKPDLIGSTDTEWWNLTIELKEV